jgi:hypothetical protein
VVDRAAHLANLERPREVLELLRAHLLGDAAR